MDAQQEVYEELLGQLSQRVDTMKQADEYVSVLFASGTETDDYSEIAEQINKMLQGHPVPVVCVAVALVLADLLLTQPVCVSRKEILADNDGPLHPQMADPDLAHLMFAVMGNKMMKAIQITKQQRAEEGGNNAD